MPGTLIFISYSHDSDEHREKVLSLAERLRQDGLDARLDQYVNGTPEQGWPRWMLDRLDEAAFVLVVCTETYYRRFRGREVPGRGKGADWEGALITQELYNDKSQTVKFVPVALAAGQEPFIPEPLRGHTFYELTSEERYQDLYAFLLGQAGVRPRRLGDLRPISQRTAQPLTFDPAPDPSLAQGSAARRPRPLLWLALPTLVLLPLVVTSTFWHVPTRVQLDLVTARLALTLGGEESREIINLSVPFSSLVIEECSTAVFAAERLEIADPRQLVPGTRGGGIPHFPAAAWREVQPTDPVKLSCRNSEAKLALQHPDPAAAELGRLDRIYFKSGSQVILGVSPDQEPALSLEIEMPQALNLKLGSDLELVAEFVEPVGIVVPFRGDLQTWRVRLPEARRIFKITSGEHRLVLIVTPARGQAGGLFPEKLNLPLAALELTEENPQEKTPASSLRDKASLSYPDYPAVPAVAIAKDEAVGLSGLAQARLRRLELDADKKALRVVFDGIAQRVATGDRTFVRDHRLTIADTFVYSRRWGLVTVAAAWLVSTTWAALGAWKKLQE